MGKVNYGPVETADFFNLEMLRRHAKDYTRVAKAAGDGIRAHDPQRLIVTDGYPGGGSPIPDLFSTGMLQSGHTYNRMQVTHHDCEWVRGAVVGSEQVPTWPLKDDKGNIICNRQKLAKDFHPWAGLSRQGGNSLRGAGLLQIDSTRCGSSLVRGHTWRFEGNELRMDQTSGAPLECPIPSDRELNSRIGKGVILIDLCSRC
jgi:hypothetical protein